VDIRREHKSSPDDSRLGMLLKRAEQTMIRAKNAVLKPIGLTLAQYVALAALDRQPGITAATLARACLVTPQAMMILLKTMEQQRLIGRFPHPRHSNVLELRVIDAGREALHAARQLLDPVERRVVDTFSAKELDAFRAFLSRFIQAMDND
jgi:DNA-binding MarR family transcriptional regulator